MGVDLTANAPCSIMRKEMNTFPQRRNGHTLRAKGRGWAMFTESLA